MESRRERDWRKFEDALIERLLARHHWYVGRRERRRRRRDSVVIHSEIVFAGVVVGKSTIRLGRLADAIQSRYRVHYVEAAFRAVGVLRAIASNGWLANLAHDEHLDRLGHDNPERVYEWLRSPEILKYSSVQRFLWREVRNRDSVVRVTKQFAEGLVARSGYQPNKGGRPRKAPPRDELKQRFFATQATLKAFHERLQKMNNPRGAQRALREAFPEVVARLEAAGLLMDLLPTRRGATMTLEAMTTRLLARELDLAGSTIQKYARSGTSTR